MKELLAVIATVLITACGGNAAPAQNQGSNAKATIDLTVTGALEGHTTQLAKTDCITPAFNTFTTTMTPVINGENYDISVIAPFKSGPVTIDLAAPDNKVLLQLHNEKLGWGKNDGTTGTLTINADGMSGSVDAHHMKAAGVQTFIDLKFTFTCPAG